MAVQTQAIDYADGDLGLSGLLAWDADAGPRPGVLIAHAWSGRTPFEDDKAAWLASKGYVGLAIDVYGSGVVGADPEENAAVHGWDDPMAPPENANQRCFQSVENFLAEIFAS